MATFSYDKTEENALYCATHEDIKGMILYKFGKTEAMFDKEIEIVRNVFRHYGLKYEEMATYDERYGFGYSFVIERG